MHGGPISLEGILHEPEFWAAVINFVLLLFVLRKLGGKSLSEFLSNRRSEMERNMTEAAELKRKAEARYTEYTERLKALDAELEKLRKDSERAAEEDKAGILAEAEEAARRFKRETESLIDQHAKALTAEVRKELVTLATAAAEKVLRETLTAADQQRLADRFKDAIGRAARPGGQS
jgi:F-type H+-transporting ATPase subunit b